MCMDKGNASINKIFNKFELTTDIVDIYAYMRKATR